MNRLTTTKTKPKIDRIVNFTIVMELGAAYGELLQSFKTLSPTAVVEFEDRTFPKIEAAILKLFDRTAMDVFIAAVLRAESPPSASPAKPKRTSNHKPAKKAKR